jgi:hypothetical protein
MISLLINLTIKLANVALNYWRLNNIEINKAVQSFNCYNITKIAKWVKSGFLMIVPIYAKVSV